MKNFLNSSLFPVIPLSYFAKQKSRFSISIKTVNLRKLIVQDVAEIMEILNVRRSRSLKGIRATKKRFLHKAGFAGLLV